MEVRSELFIIHFFFQAPYVRQLALIHAVYGPLIYMIRSREFASAVRKMLRPNSARLDDVNYF
jgi:hypothetical protein